MQINEITEFHEVLQYISPDLQDSFCEAWYQGLDPYKNYPESLLLVANAILNHWHVPLYAKEISGWDDEHCCFIWNLWRTRRKQQK
jgi:hypothetical protein